MQDCVTRFADFLIVLATLLAFVAQGQELRPRPDRWTNSLGMVFVKIPEGRLWVSIWETRIQDYEPFVKEGHWGRLWPKRPDFDQAPTHPVVNVSWEDAKEFCIWLSQKELTQRLLSSNEIYRLPTDLEWSDIRGT